MSALSTQGNNFTDEQILAWIEEGKSGRHPKYHHSLYDFNVASLARWVSSKTGKTVSEQTLKTMISRVTCHQGPVLKDERKFIATKNAEGFGAKAIQNLLTGQNFTVLKRDYTQIKNEIRSIKSAAKKEADYSSGQGFHSAKTRSNNRQNQINKPSKTQDLSALEALRGPPVVKGTNQTSFMPLLQQTRRH